MTDEQTRMSRFTRRHFLSDLAAMSAATILAACGNSSPTDTPKAATLGSAAGSASPVSSSTGAQAATSPGVTTSRKQGGTLVAAGDALGDNFVPAVGFQGWARVWVSDSIYDTLYTTRDLKTLIPSLALSNTVSSDGLVYIFKLRQGVKFHDGTPFNAAAVEFNYMRYIDKNHPFYDQNAIDRTNILTDVDTVKATDDYTVEVRRTKPNWSFPSLLTVASAGIMSPTAVKKYGVQDAGRNPVGTGPFVFEKAEKGNQASFTAFDEYWNGRPMLDRVVVRVIADDQAMTASLLSGDVDITSFVDFKEVANFRKNAKLNVQVTPAASTGYMGVNQLHPTLKDVRVRQALTYAVDKQKIIDVIFYGEADIGAGLIPIPMSAYAPQFKDYNPHDPQKAKELLKEAGASPDLTLYTQNTSFWPRIAELMQADFTAVGLKTQIQQIDTAKFYSQMTEGNHQIFIGDSTYSTPNPDELFWILYGVDQPRAKRWGYADPKFDALRSQEAAEQDPDKRKQILWDMQKMLLDTVVQVPNYYNRFVTVTNKRVEGYTAMPTRDMFLGKTSVSS